ncbi:unnamed protein product [Pleuronectes platessa]|uniref:Uncharacterized protein n=1 Tax=Pleuronectes platessa TaxID=8262 RepID=A0A9N7Z8R9_PLEPL|nr:unnamed protein product [Pleuronectes platessa]
MESRGGILTFHIRLLQALPVWSRTTAAGIEPTAKSTVKVPRSEQSHDPEAWVGPGSPAGQLCLTGSELISPLTLAHVSVLAASRPRPPLRSAVILTRCLGPGSGHRPDTDHRISDIPLHTPTPPLWSHWECFVKTRHRRARPVVRYIKPGVTGGGHETPITLECQRDVNNKTSTVTFLQINTSNDKDEETNETLRTMRHRGQQL